MKKRLLSLLLALVMALGMLPAAAWAGDADDGPVALTVKDLTFKVVMSNYTDYMSELIEENGGNEGNIRYTLPIPDSGMQVGSSLEIALPEGSQEKMEVSYMAWDYHGETPTVKEADENGKVSISDWFYSLPEPHWCDKITISLGSGDDKASYTVEIAPFLTLRALNVQETEGNKNYRPFNLNQVYQLNDNYNNPIIGQTDLTTDVVQGTTVTIGPIPGVGSMSTPTIKINGVEQKTLNYIANEDASQEVVIEISADGFQPTTYHLTLLTSEKDLFPVLGSFTVDNKTTGQIIENPKNGPALKEKITQFDEVVLSVEELSGADDVSYQWTIGFDIQDETGASLKMDTSTAAKNNYKVKVTRTANGRVYTSAKDLKMVPVIALKVDKPTITEQPVSAEYTAGHNAAPLFCKYDKNMGFTYSIQWYCNSENSTVGGTALGMGSNIAGGGSYYTPNISAPGTYYYFFGVKAASNGVESEEAFSEIAVITALPLENFLEGSGTEQEPYLIHDLDDLKAVKDMVENGTAFADTYFKLTDDITLDAEWTPIGNTKDGSKDAQNGINLNPFSGVFDGGGHMITIPENGLPLFNYVREATIQNLELYGEKIASYGLLHSYTVDYGADGNYNSGVPQTVTIDRVTLKSGSATLKSGLLGGFGSGGNYVEIRNCTIEDDVTIGYDHDQSSIGSFAGSFNGLMTSCVSYADVYGVNRVGGLAGSKGQSMGPCSIQNSEFYGTVTATGEYAGGALGAGYDGSGTAPNTPVATIKNCLVSGDVTGTNNIGGILGGEPGCEDCWSNGSGTVSDNIFYGTITGTGSNVGGIVGFMKSFNKYQGMENNYYLERCGAASGIGAIEHIITKDDPKYGDHGIDYVFDANKFCTAKTAEEMADGTVVELLNKSNTGFKNWIQGDAHPTHSDQAVAYALTISGTYRDEYYIGDELDLTGAVFTVDWSDGTTTTPALNEVTISGYDLNTRGVQTLTAAYGAAQTDFTVTVLKRSGGDNPSTITVSFTLLGDETHDSDSDGRVHTLKNNNLETWIEHTNYTVSLNATVKDVVDQALRENNMTCSNPTGNYIESITRNGETLGEFTNGSLSGWMYTLNGEHVLLGVSEQFLENGDEIIFHYTDDYKVEKGSEHWNSGGSSDDADQKAADAVVGLIKAIGTVTKESGTKIEAARKAYDALTAAQKKLVTNYGVLTKAESDYAQLTLGVPFTDVADHWALEAIRYAYEHKLMDGIGNNTFAPNSTLNRAMLVTLLYRLEGTPSVTGGHSFTDVANGEWYADAVAWANANGIVSGMGAGTFAPTVDITREQMATMLYNYAKYKGYDTTQGGMALKEYGDYESISGWAQDALNWANAAGLVTGRTESAIVPGGTATRAEAATILQRFAIQIVKQEA